MSILSFRNPFYRRAILCSFTITTIITSGCKQPEPPFVCINKGYCAVHLNDKYDTVNTLQAISLLRQHPPADTLFVCLATGSTATMDSVLSTANELHLKKQIVITKAFYQLPGH